MNVLMVHNYYQQGGGEHTVFESETALLRENGVQVFTYTRDNKDLKKKPWRLALLPLATVWSPSAYRQVRRLIREHHIDLVHCHNTFPQISPAVYYACWKSGVPVVQTVHNFRFVCPNGLFFRDGSVCEDCLQGGLGCSLAHRCYRGSLVQTLPVALMLAVHRRLGTYKRLPCIFLTRFNRDKIAPRLGIQTSFVKPNFTRMERAGDLPVEPDKFVFVGRLDEYKGILWAARQFAAMPGRRLVIFGDGAQRPALEQLAAEHDNIQLRGFCGQAEIARELESTCGLVFPSILYEGFPVTIADSFALGTPVICADLGNAGDLVQEGENGAKYAPGDEKGFRQAVERLSRDRQRLGQGALRAAQQYTQKENLRQLLEIYRQLKGETDGTKS